MRTTICPTVWDAALPPIAYDHLYDPNEAHRVISQAREHGPMAMGPHGPEVLSYELVRSVLRDPRFAPAVKLVMTAQGITSGPVWDRAAQSILGLEGETHRRLRRLVSKAFTPRGAERLRTLIVDLVTDLIDPLAIAGHCDVVADIARRYPTPVICALLGVPRRDWQLFSAWSDDIKKVFEWDVANDQAAIAAAWAELDAYLEEMLTQRRDNLTDDLVSDLIRAEDDGDRLSHRELVMLAGTLLIAGTDTTRNQLAAAVYFLQGQPDQWTLLGQHPELAGNAVHELMRYFPIVFALARTAREDVELGGVIVPAGSLVVVNIAAAQRDPTVYGDPDRLDITREPSTPILPFGSGAHYCLGSHLARLELVEALKTITRRMPNPRPNGPACWKQMTGITGPTALPVAFDRGH
ncbi:MAG: cytochrome P450 [Mycobacterium sp.]|nr:cytochrome P450 [Mycobacterium sp.]MBV9722042.1 cytochrome P450 [Mycobacterium sp.]